MPVSSKYSEDTNHSLSGEQKIDVISRFENEACHPLTTCKPRDKNHQQGLIILQVMANYLLSGVKDKLNQEA